MTPIDGKPYPAPKGDPDRDGGKGEGRETPVRETGTGALCPEAQADGVPCPEIGRDCEIC